MRLSVPRTSTIPVSVSNAGPSTIVPPRSVHAHAIRSPSYRCLEGQCVDDTWICIVAELDDLFFMSPDIT